VFKQGATAEEIVYRYPSLKLADLYAAIGFYLNHLDTFPAECPYTITQVLDTEFLPEATDS
jgi:hypothetical protein